MSKTIKKPVKTNLKKIVKSDTKPSKAGKAAATSAKPQQGAKKGEASAAAGKSLVKTLTGAVAKVFGKESGLPAKTEKAKTKKDAKKKSPKKDQIELDDDMLVADEDMGAEEIPDLSEFDENEEEVVEDETSVEVFTTEAKTPSPDDEVVLTDAEGRRYCRVRDCDQVSMVEGYCRFHYLALWKKIQVRRKILADGKLERYVEELTSRYPDKFLEMIRRDLRTEKDFLSAIAELEIDESVGDNDFEEETQSYIDEVRGLSSESSMAEEEDSF